MWNHSQILGAFLLLSYSALLVVQVAEGLDSESYEYDDSSEAEPPSSGQNSSSSQNHTQAYQNQTTGGGGGGGGGGLLNGTDGSSGNDTLRQFGGQDFGDSCSSNGNGRQCRHSANLVCSTSQGYGNGRCICKSGHVHLDFTRQCWPVLNSTGDYCAHDIQCHSGTFGRLSRCSKHSARCECYDYDSNGKRETTRGLNGVCQIKVSQGDSCRRNEDCEGPMGEGAYCRLSRCECKDEYTWYNPIGQCLPLATRRYDTCIVTDQCRKGSLGRWSLCVQDTAKCDCSPLTEPFNAGGGDRDRYRNETRREVVYYERMRKCYLRRDYNQTCEDDNECRASLGEDVKCGPNDPYRPREDICYCPKGKVCRSGAFSIIKQSTSLMAWTATAAAVGVTAYYANGMTCGWLGS